MRQLPNLLSCFRILLVPVLVAVLLTKFEEREFVGLAVFLVAALTDVLDGYIARRWGLVTRLGKLLDPAADKILTSAAFISLVEIGRAPSWIVAAIVAREFAVSTLRSVAAAEGMVIVASKWGKAKTAVQVVAISILILDHRLGALAALAPWALWAALLISVGSGIEYGWRYARLVLHGAARAEPAPPG